MDETLIAQDHVSSNIKIHQKLKMTTSLDAQLHRRADVLYESLQAKQRSMGCLRPIKFGYASDRISKSMIVIRQSSSQSCTPANLETVQVMDDTLEQGQAREHDRRTKKKCCAIVDGFISSFVVAPLVVGSWRGIWIMMDRHIAVFPPYPIACCGLAVHLSFALIRYQFQRFESAARCSTIFSRLASRLYCWMFLISCVSHWRGGWEAWPGFKAEGLATIARMAVCLAVLVALRSTRNLLTAPFFVQVDSAGCTYHFPTRFRQSSREPLLYLLDCLFSVVVVGSLVVFVWRGAWDLLDVYLFPDNTTFSAWTSFVLGYGLAIVTFLLQGAARRACTRLEGAKRLIVADLFLLLSFVSTINVWRSIWSLLDIYFIPENPELSNWLTHGVCFVLLMLLNCSNSVIVRGVYIDAEEEGGQCVVFPCYYLRLFFQKERLKKRRKLLEQASAESHQTGAQPLIKSASGPIIVKAAPPNHVVVHLTTHEEAPPVEKNGDAAQEPT